MKNKLAIVVDEDIIEETKSKTLFVLNNKLTWKELLHGDNENNTTKEEGRNPEEVIKIHEQEEINDAFGRYFLLKISVLLGCMETLVACKNTGKV